MNIYAKQENYCSVTQHLLWTDLILQYLCCLPIQVASGIPLGVILTSDEREETILTGLQMLKSILPNHVFYGKGPQAGPDVVMIDDSSTERGAISKCWPNACILLCTFHFLQRQYGLGCLRVKIKSAKMIESLLYKSLGN